MGLDSVELIVRFEKEFKKDIPDQVAETIGTIGDMVDWFYKNIEIHKPDKKMDDEILKQLKDVFAKLNLQYDFNFDSALKDYIPKNDLINTWKELKKELNLKIPKLNSQDLADKKRKDLKILGLIISSPKPPILNMKFERFIGCIGALNYKKFVDFDSITNLFEIKIAVIGITQDQCGVSIDRIFMNSSFTNDLGID